MIFGMQTLFEQRNIDHIVMLVNPQGFEDIVIVSRTIFIETHHPLGDGSNHIGGWPAREFDPGPCPDAIIGFQQSIEKFFNRLTSNRCRLDQFPAFMTNPIDTSMDAVTIGVTQVMLHVPDDGILPVSEIDRTIGCRFNVRRTEVGIRR